MEQQPEFQGFATPAAEAQTVDPDGRIRIKIDPVESRSNQAADMSAIFRTAPEDEFDADAEHEKYEVAENLRSIGVEPFPDVINVRPGIELTEDDLGLEPGDMQASSGMDLSTVPGDMGQAMFVGMNQGATEIMDSAALIAGLPVEAAKGVINLGFDAVGMEPIKSAFGDIDTMKSVVGGYTNLVNAAVPIPDSVKDWAMQPYDNEMLGELTEGITQFTVAAFPAAKMVKAMTTANPIARGFMWGAIADFTAFNPDDPTIIAGIADYLIDAPAEERGPVLQILMAQIEKYEDDPELVKRAKTALEGAIIGGAVEGIFQIVKLSVKQAQKIPFRQIIDNAGQAADARIAARTGVTLTAGVDPTPMVDAALSAAGKVARRQKLTKVERDIIKQDVANQTVAEGEKPLTVKQVVGEAERIKNEYPPEEGWLPINVQTGSTNPTFKVNKEGVLEIRWQQPAYAFHNPPGEKLKGAAGKAQREAHEQNLVDITVSDVTAIVERARNGDQAAIEIINQGNWYRSMRTRLRQEFGGLGDVFADLIGATSAQTNVQQNYENALQVLRRFTRGEFDEEIAIYQARIDAGDKMGSPELTKLHKDENSPFKLITKASGALFNTNSPAATEALLDMFRQIKANKAPKTINFTGNLIGFGTDATIDVWAARFLRDAAGLPRIPPPAEKAVSGKHLTASTFEDPQIGAEFGFGQNVFAKAAAELNASGVIKQINPDLGDVGPDDLQAIVWFLEKEKWTKNGWTTKAGEGGSLDYESVYGGSPDRDRVADLRSLINKKFTPPAKRKKDTDEEYAKRVAEAENADTQAKDAARAELSTLEGEPQRFVAGVARERPNAVPTNIEQNELAQEVLRPVLDDDKVIGAQANNTYGEFMGDLERSLNYEVVTQVDFDPTEMTRSLIEAGKKYEQDAVFVSKVVPPGTANARPGGEVYFKNRQGVDFAQQVTQILKKYKIGGDSIDGFTYITDARQSDRVDVQAGGDEQTAGLVGVRFQYIPEFAGTTNDPNLAAIMEEAQKVYAQAMEEILSIDGITYADVVFYDTKVYANTNVDYVVGATSYEDFGTVAGRDGGAVRQGQPNGGSVEPADSGG